MDKMRRTRGGRWQAGDGWLLVCGQQLLQALQGNLCVDQLCDKLWQLEQRHSKHLQRETSMGTSRSKTCRKSWENAFIYIRTAAVTQQTTQHLRDHEILRQATN